MRRFFGDLLCQSLEKPAVPSLCRRQFAENQFPSKGRKRHHRPVADNLSSTVSIIVGLWLVLIAFQAAPAMSQSNPPTVQVDFSRPDGTIRPLNGVNGGPLCERGWVDLSDYFRNLGIKSVRLNDVPWTFDDALDVNYVSPRFDADPNNPGSYDFSQTDWYLSSIKSLGIDIIYDLGPTAEYPALPPRNNHPPADFQKWASICVHIVKHYDGGWANGFHYGIKHWEIWNEPDGGNFSWQGGTPLQYYKLYETTARAIKAYDPALNVGGPALASRVSFLDGFLRYCMRKHVPLDFVSWHMYGMHPEAIHNKAEKIEQMLRNYGFPSAENILDEWSYWPGNWNLMPYKTRGLTDPWYLNSVARKVQGSEGAAFAASVLILLQNTAVYTANFYHGATIVMWGMFNENGVPHKTYYAFKAFHFLLETPARVRAVSSQGSGLTEIAGLSPDRTEATVLVSNYGTQRHQYDVRLENLPWKHGAVYKTYILDRDRNLALVGTETLAGSSTSLHEVVEAPSVCVIRLRAAQSTN
jgi:xylan 1,4-beta-xylosidase